MSRSADARRGRGLGSEYHDNGASVDLRDFFLEVATHYEQGAGFKLPSGDWVPGQALVRSAAGHLNHLAPLGYEIRSGAGQYPLNPSHVPWFGFLDPDETVTPTRGIYVPYILRADKSAWTASVNFGVTHLNHGQTRELREKLRALIPGNVLADWDDGMVLGAPGGVAGKYELAAIIARTYPVDDLPNEAELRDDLTALLRVYETLVKAKNAAAASDPVFADLPRPELEGADDEFVWDPGNDVDTEILVKGGKRRRRPRHERGLRLYGDWLRERGMVPSTKVHPRDFVVKEPDVLGEYKVVYGGNDVKASREALAQLLDYRHFYHPSEDPILLAVFSEEISKDRVTWLEGHGIAVAWPAGGEWAGSPLACASGLALEASS